MIVDIKINLDNYSILTYNKQKGVFMKNLIVGIIIGISSVFAYNNQDEIKSKYLKTKDQVVSLFNNGSHVVETLLVPQFEELSDEVSSISKKIVPRKSKEERKPSQEKDKSSSIQKPKTKEINTASYSPKTTIRIISE